MRFLRGAAVVLAIAVLAGCGDSAGGGTSTTTIPETTKAESTSPQGSEPLEITIDGYPSPDYVGLFLANKRGYLKDAGVELSIHTPIIPRRPIPYVLQESADLGVSHAPEALLGRERGEPIVAVGTLLPYPTTSIAWPQSSGIRGVDDLAGKTIGTEGLPFQERFLEAMLAGADLSRDDVKVRKVGYHLTSMLEKGKVDAVVGNPWSIAGLHLKTEESKPELVPVSDLGFPRYDELVLVAQQDRLPELGPRIRGLLKGWARGNRAAIEEPKAAAEALAEESYRVPPWVIREGVDQALPLLTRNFRMDPDRWDELGTWMQSEGIAEQPPPASELLTNAYVP